MESTLKVVSCTCVFAALACTPIASLLMAPSAQAQAWPSKPVRWIVPFAPGGGVDVTTRTIAQRLAATLGQQFVIDNRGGANGNIGVELATKAPADGHTLLMATTGNITINPHIYSKLDVRSAARSDAGDPAVDVINVLVVHPGAAREIREGVDRARESASGRAQLRVERTRRLRSHRDGAVREPSRARSSRNISYKGGAPAMVDLVAGNIQMMIATMAVAVGPIKGERLRPLGVTEPQALRADAADPDRRRSGRAGLRGSLLVRHVRAEPERRARS